MPTNPFEPPKLKLDEETWFGVARIALIVSASAAMGYGIYRLLALLFRLPSGAGF